MILDNVCYLTPGSNTLLPCTWEAWKGTEMILSAFSQISEAFGSRWQQERCTDELNNLPVPAFQCYALPF